MRRDDWPERFAKVVRASRDQFFDWSRHDCVTHAADGALAVTGLDPAADFREAYDDYMGGFRRLLALTGLRSIEAWADSLFERIAPALARRGDWALVRQPAAPGGRAHPALMLVDGEWLSGPGGDRLPRSVAVICWRVG